MGLRRQRNYAGRWDVLIQQATQCLNRLIQIAARKKRNYILDQVLTGDHDAPGGGRGLPVGCLGIPLQSFYFPTSLFYGTGGQLHMVVQSQTDHSPLSPVWGHDTPSSDSQ